MKPLWIASLVGLTVLAAIGWLYRGETTTFWGLAESLEIPISSPLPGELVRMRVQVGQELDSGDTLLDLENSDLAARIAQLNHQLDRLQGSNGLDSAQIQSRRLEIEAVLQSKRNSLMSEIDRLEAERSDNSKLARSLQSLTASQIQQIDSGRLVEMRIKELRRQIEIEESSAADQLRLLVGSTGSQTLNSRAQREAAIQELQILTRKRERLSLIAPQSGIVSAIHSRQGQSVPAFAPLLTLSDKRANLVRGFILETADNRVAAGNQVSIESTRPGATALTGTVIGLGTRIVPFPTRLKRVPEAEMWGREVIVSLPKANSILPGEKVLVRPLSALGRIYGGWK